MFFIDGKQHKARQLDTITRDLECPSVDMMYLLLTEFEVRTVSYEDENQDESKTSQ